MPETPFEEKVRQTLREQADKQPFDPNTVKPTAKRARRRLQRDAMLAAAFAVLALASLTRIGVSFAETSTPAGPSPTLPPSEVFAGPASTPSGLQVSYDETNLTVQGVDHAVGASNFSIRFYPRSRGGVCITVTSVIPAFVRTGGVVFQDVTDCPGGIPVGTGFGIGQTVMMFAPSETSSVTATSHGALQDALVLDLPSAFVDRLSTELGGPFDRKVVVVTTPVHGGRLIATDAAGRVLSTMRLPVANLNSYCGPPGGAGVRWCPGRRA